MFLKGSITIILLLFICNSTYKHPEQPHNNPVRKNITKKEQKPERICYSRGWHTKHGTKTLSF